MGFPGKDFYLFIIFLAFSGTMANELDSFQYIKMMSMQRTIKITKKGLEDKRIH